MNRVSRLLFSGLTIGIAAGAANAQEYPVKPVRIIVPYTAGGGSDLLGRLAAKKLGERSIIAHGADRFLTDQRHRLDVELDVFLTVAKGLLAEQQGGGAVARFLRGVVRRHQGVDQADVHRVPVQVMVVVVGALPRPL